MKKNFKTAVQAATRGFYQENACTLVGFSGGADSTALLLVLSEILGKDRVIALHVNHHLRGDEATRDEHFCIDFCEKRGIPLIVRHVDVNAIRGSQGVEEAARQARYALFYKVAKETDCKTVSLAHNADDAIETMLFHISRGAGIRGLAGIPVTRRMDDIEIVRPLLDFSREEIEKYLTENGVSHVEDSTNGDTAYTRNFIRAEIVPKLKQLNPSLLQNVRNTQKVLTETAMDIESRADAYLQSENPEQTENLLTLPLPVLQEVIRRMAESGGADSLSHAQVTAVTALLLEKKKGHEISLTGNITAAVDGNALVFSRKNRDSTLQYEKTSLHTGENRFDGFRIYVNEMPPSDILPKASFYKKTAIPPCDTLYIRKKEDGDRYLQGGMTKKIKKCLCGFSSLAKSRPLFTAGGEIIWHPDLPHADFQNRECTVELYYLEIEEV